MTDDERLWSRLKPKDREYADDIVDIVNRFNKIKKMYFPRSNGSKVYNKGTIKWVLHWLKDGYTPDDFEMVFAFKIHQAKRMGYTFSVKTFLWDSKFEDNLEKAEDWLKSDQKYTRIVAKQIIDTFLKHELNTYISHKDQVFLEYVENILLSNGRPSPSAIERTVLWMKQQWEPHMISPVALVKTPEKFRQHLLNSKIYFKKKQQQTIV